MIANYREHALINQLKTTYAIFSEAYKLSVSGNGTGCTGWVLEKENMDYLRRDISEDWK